MSGLYNVICGMNPLTPILLGAIDVSAENESEWPLGRFRDATISPDGRRVFLLTRNGSGGFDEVNEKWKSHPGFVAMHLSDDASYLTYEIQIERFRTLSDYSCDKHNLPRGTQVDQWAEMQRRAVPTSAYDPLERMKQALQDFKDGKDTPEAQRQLAHMQAAQVAFEEAIKTGVPQTFGNEHGKCVAVPLPSDDPEQVNVGVFDEDAGPSLNTMQFTAMRGQYADDEDPGQETGQEAQHA